MSDGFVHGREMILTSNADVSSARAPDSPRELTVRLLHTVVEASVPVRRVETRDTVIPPSFVLFLPVSRVSLASGCGKRVFHAPLVL